MLPNPLNSYVNVMGAGLANDPEYKDEIYSLSNSDRVVQTSLSVDYIPGTANPFFGGYAGTLVLNNPFNTIEGSKETLELIEERRLGEVVIGLISLSPVGGPTPTYDV